MRFFPCLVLLAFVAGCKSAPTPPNVTPAPTTPVATTFRNPLLNAGPDPWVAQRDSFYYYTHTGGDKIELRKTKAMSRLSAAPVVTAWRAPASGGNARNLWAPELHYLDGKWYLYYTAGSSADLATQRTWALENASPDPTTGTWVDKGQLFIPAQNYWAIDGTVFTLGSVHYFLWSGYDRPSDITQRIYIARMANPWTLTGPRTELTNPQFDWERIGDPGPKVNEGPEVLQRNGKVFLVYSASGCWTDDYALGMLTMDATADPLLATSWRKSPQPVFTKSPEAGAFGPGHNGFFRSPDGTQDWLIYHANPRTGLGCNDLRSPRMQPFTWSTDGSPNFGRPVPLATELPRPAGEK